MFVEIKELVPALRAALESVRYGAKDIQRAEHQRRGRSPRTFRYAPGGFHCEACRILGYGDSHDVARTIHAYELESYLGVAR